MSHPHSRVRKELVLPSRRSSPPPARRVCPQTGGGRAGLITAPETHQRHPAPALCLSSKLPAKGGSAPALHLVSFYGNRKQLLVGDGEAEVKGAGGGGGEGAIHNFCSLPKAPARGRDGEEASEKSVGGDAEDAWTPRSRLLGPAHLRMQPTHVLGSVFPAQWGFPFPWVGLGSDAGSRQPPPASAWRKAFHGGVPSSTRAVLPSSGSRSCRGNKLKFLTKIALPHPKLPAELKSLLCTDHRSPRRTGPMEKVVLWMRQHQPSLSSSTPSPAAPQIFSFPFRFPALPSTGNRSGVRIYMCVQDRFLGRAVSSRNWLSNWVSYAHFQEQVAANKF